MKAKTGFEWDEQMEVEIIDDFLPSPEELAFKEETVKITISLSRQSIDYFKALASRHQTPYQKLIRRLLDEYASRHMPR